MRLDDMEQQVEGWEPPSKKMYWLPKMPSWSIPIFGLVLFLFLFFFLLAFLGQVGEVQKSPTGGLPIGEVKNVNVRAEAVNLDEYVEKDGLRANIYMLDRYGRYVRTDEEDISLDATLYGIVDGKVGPELEAWGPVELNHTGVIGSGEANLSEGDMKSMQSSTSGGGLFSEKSGDPRAFKTYLLRYGGYRSDEYQMGRLEIVLQFPDGRRVMNSTDVRLI